MRIERSSKRDGTRDRGFTLIELILVMVLLLTVVGVAIPSLSGFFRGRTLDSEARRFLALTRHGQSRAVGEGVPVLLWVDERERRYGLEQDPAFVRFDTNAVEFEAGEDVEIETMAGRVSLTNRVFGGAPAGMRLIAGRGQLPTIRFEPDGGVTAGSMEGVRIWREPQGSERAVRGKEDSLWIARGRDRVSYEIQTNMPNWFLR
jgi:type II secretion system protein H